ncbi:MAG: hypothetical protein HOQ06_02150 [Pseudarthrobacter sp.]|nr:hypothetical protein [Pseudarthrobacter sp.]
MDKNQPVAGVDDEPLGVATVIRADDVLGPDAGDEASGHNRPVHLEQLHRDQCPAEEHLARIGAFSAGG